MKERENQTMGHYDQVYKAMKENDREGFRSSFLKLHTRDQKELFHLLTPVKKKKIADFLDPKEFAGIFEFLEFEDQEEAIEYLPTHYMAEVLNQMAADDVSHYLVQLPIDKRRPVLEMMDKEDREEVEELLSYERRTAGSIMTKEFISVTIDQTASDVIKKLRIIGKDAETIYYMFVVDTGMHLRGVVSLRDLIVSSEEETVGNLMSEQVISVSLAEDQKEVARIIQEYDLLAVPVLDIEGILLGIVTVDDVLDVLEAETTEDFQEFSAINPSEKKEDNAFQTAKARVPWIVILIFLGMITAGLISSFESTLQSVVALAAFIPIIMDAAGNVGTQSLAVAVRDISLEDKSKPKNLMATIRREFGAGFLIGIAAAIAVFILVMVLYRNPILASVIAVSMLITLSVSAVVGATVPLLIQKMNIDPAIASGPFITTINDALGLFIYFTIATFLLAHL